MMHPFLRLAADYYFWAVGVLLVTNLLRRNLKPH